MPKTVTLRISDNEYELFKKAANGQKRSLSNFIEYATLAYLVEETTVSDYEMEEILNDKKLMKNLENGLKDIENGRYKIIE